jgi:predicted naringenin-chalcone synthase
VLLCLELPSLHAQPATATTDVRRASESDVQQMVAHALFSDAAAAVVMRPEGAGLELLDVVALTDPSTSDHMTWDITDLGFRMGLSPRVPDVLARHVRGVVDDLLRAHGLARDDVAGWAVHPGGPRILDVVEERLDLDPSYLAPSRGVLRDFGNCSSATVLLVLERVLRTDVGPGDHVVAMAFGPGLTLYAALLQLVDR